MTSCRRRSFVSVSSACSVWLSAQAPSEWLITRVAADQPERAQLISLHAALRRFSKHRRGDGRERSSSGPWFSVVDL